MEKNSAYVCQWLGTGIFHLQNHDEMKPLFWKEQNVTTHFSTSSVAQNKSGNKKL
jgi:hypothetical protein